MKLIALVVEERIGSHHKRGNLLPRNGFEYGIDFRLCTCRQDMDFQTKSRMQQPEPLRLKVVGQNVNPRDICTRPVEARDQPCLHRVAADGEDDRNGRGRGLRC